MAEPTIPLPKWADEDSDNPETGRPNVQEPPGSVQKVGFNAAGLPVPRQWFNWLHRSAYRWLSYFRDENIDRKQEIEDEQFARENDVNNVRANLLNEVNGVILEGGESGYGSFAEMVSDNFAKFIRGVRRVGTQSLGFFFSSTSSPATSGSGNTTLWSIPVDGDLLKRDGDQLHISGAVFCANNSNSKGVIVYFGGALGVQIVGSSTQFQNTKLSFTAILERTSSTTATIIVSGVTLYAQQADIGLSGALLTGLDFSTPNNLDLVGFGVASSDVIGRHFSAVYVPARAG